MADGDGVGARDRVCGLDVGDGFAEALGESRHVSLLEATLAEEKEADDKLTELAGEINQQALGGERIPPDRDEVSGKKRARRIA